MTQPGLPLYAIRHGQALHNVMYAEAQTRAVYFTNHVFDSPLTISGHHEAIDVGRGRTDPADAAGNGQKGVGPKNPNYRFGLNHGAGPMPGAKAEIDVVLVSPLARALQTASNLWRDEIVAAGFEFPSWEAVDHPQEWLQLASDSAVAQRAKGTDFSPARCRSRLRVRFVALDQLREYAVGMTANSRLQRQQLEIAFPWVDFSLLLADEDALEKRTLADATEGMTEVCETQHRIETFDALWRRIAAFKRMLMDRSLVETSVDTQSTNARRDLDPVNLAGQRVVFPHESDHAGKSLYDFVRPPFTRRLALVSHSAFLARMLFACVGNEASPLCHVYPYQYVMTSWEHSPPVPFEAWETQRFPPVRPQSPASGIE